MGFDRNHSLLRAVASGRPATVNGGAPGTLAAWLQQAHLSEHALSAEQKAVLQTSFQFLQECGHDYYSLRLLGHYLLHCGSGLQITQICLLLGISRSTGSQQRGMASRDVVKAAYHRLVGRPYGKLLPRYAGPLAQFLLEHPQCRCADILAFIEETWGVRVSNVALYRFLKKFGIRRGGRTGAVPLETAALDRSALSDRQVAQPVSPSPPTEGEPVS
jgi:hypothetical protein